MNAIPPISQAPGGSDAAQLMHRRRPHRRHRAALIRILPGRYAMLAASRLARAQ